jgi:small subunit ribosomal protein S20
LANLKSQIKRNRQNEKRRVRNRTILGRARTTERKALQVIEKGITEDTKAAALEAMLGLKKAGEKDVSEVEALARAAISALDTAAEKGAIHKNNASRRKSRLMKQLAALKP